MTPVAEGDCPTLFVVFAFDIPVQLLTSGETSSLTAVMGDFCQMRPSIWLTGVCLRPELYMGDSLINSMSDYTCLQRSKYASRIDTIARVVFCLRMLDRLV